MGGPTDSQYTALRLMIESLGKTDDLRGTGNVYRPIPVPDYLFDGDAYLKSLKEGSINLRAEINAIN